MELVISAAIRRRAKKAGACSVPPAGTHIGEISQEDLKWAMDSDVLTREEISSLPAPLWSLGHSGDGSGSGYGSGDWDGYGYGSGDGYGYGYGCGSGDGSGSGYGSRNCDGAGSGDGSGSGYGSGDWDGAGSGD